MIVPACEPRGPQPPRAPPPRRGRVRAGEGGGRLHGDERVRLAPRDGREIARGNDAHADVALASEVRLDRAGRQRFGWRGGVRRRLAQRAHRGELAEHARRVLALRDDLQRRGLPAVKTSGARARQRPRRSGALAGAAQRRVGRRGAEAADLAREVVGRGAAAEREDVERGRDGARLEPHARDALDLRGRERERDRHLPPARRR